MLILFRSFALECFWRWSLIRSWVHIRRGVVGARWFLQPLRVLSTELIRSGCHFIPQTAVDKKLERLSLKSVHTRE